MKDIAEDIDDKIVKNNKEQTNDLLNGINKGFNQLIDVMRELMPPKQNIFEEPVVRQKTVEEPVIGQNYDENPIQSQNSQNWQNFHCDENKGLVYTGPTPSPPPQKSPPIKLVQKPAAGNLPVQLQILKDQSKRQQEQIDQLILRIETLEKYNGEPKSRMNVWPSIRQAHLKSEPSPVIDLQGNTLNEPTTGNIETVQPIDMAKFKKSRKFNSDRPKLSDTMNVKVKVPLNNQMQEDEAKRKPNQEQRQEKDISNQERNQRIVQMFEKSSQYLGFAPFTKAGTAQAMENMERRGVFHPRESHESKYQRTIKSLIKSWTRQHLKMTDEEWTDINVTEILPTAGEDSNIIFLRFESSDDVAKFNAKAKNLPKTNLRDSPRLIMHVDNRARQRYRAFQRVAKTIRQESKGDTQTSICSGRYDFLLRRRERDDPTPWGSIPPIRMEAGLPPIEIGMYKSRHEMDLINEEIEKKSIDDEQQEMDYLANEMNHEEERINKREHSNENMSLSTKKKRMNHKPSRRIEDSSSDSSTGTESGTDTDNESKKSGVVFNSTPFSTSNQPEPNTVPETPDFQPITKQNTLSQNYIPVNPNPYAPLIFQETSSSKEVLTKQFPSSRQNALQKPSKNTKMSPITETKKSNNDINHE